MPQDRYWFKAKRYGWGWGLPATWEGWLVLAAYLMAVLLPLIIAGDRGASISTAAAVGGALILLCICLWKGEPPRWRWGDRR